jgi:Putative peptidoglycan binding domain
MQQILACGAMLGFVFLAWGAEPAQPAKKQSPAASKRTPAKKTVGARKAPAKGTTARTATAHRSGTPARKGAKTVAASRTAAWRTRQLAPTPDRYHEIQNALAAKGYMKPEEANGTWGQSSVDALKRFQADQKIESTGKLNSLSLIALGLGPKHDSAAAKPPAPALPAPAPVQAPAPGRL